MMKKPLLKMAFAAVVAMTVQSCASTNKESKEPVDKSGGRSRSDAGKRGRSSSVSANRTTMTNSLSNNPLSSATISGGKADALVSRLNGKDKSTIEGKLSAERLARRSTAQILGTAKRLAEAEMQKGADRQVSDEVKLEVAIAAINVKNFELAEHFLSELFESKNARVRAGAYNAIGAVALRDDRVPEAVEYFRQSLKAVSNYRPALLNLGFAALKGGDLQTAKRALGGMQSDWFVQYGLITVARLEGNDSRANELCERVLKKEPSHKAALFNCGLFEFQNRRNYKKAIELVNKAGKARGGEPGWGERISQMETHIDQEEARARAAEARKKAEAEPQKNEKPKPSGGDGKPQGGNNLNVKGSPNN